MLSTSEIDLEPYTSIPNLDVPSLLTLSRQLQTVALPRTPAQVKRSLDELAATTQALSDGFGQHLAKPSAIDQRPIDQMADNSWSCFYKRLLSYANLPADRYPSAARCAELVELLFPDGLMFLTLEYGAQHAEAERRLTLIDKKKLRPELEALCGADFVAELYRCHAVYSQMVGISQPKPARIALPDLRMLRLNTQHAMNRYAIQLVALYLASESDEKLKAAIRPSFAAIDAYREKAAPERPAPTPPAAPTEPESTAAQSL